MCHCQTRHEQEYLEAQTRDVLRTIVEGQTGMLELSLPADAQTLDLTHLQMGHLNGDALLRFRALMDDMSDRGLESFVVADRDNVVLLSLDPRQVGSPVGAPVPALGTITEATVTSKREGKTWRMIATSPIRNQGGTLAGSLHVTLNMAEAEGLVRKTRRALWSVGCGVVAAGVVLSWALAAPLRAIAGQLVAHAARVAQGDYLRLDRPKRPGFLTALVTRTSLRTRLTVAMVLIALALVGILEGVILPIERYHVEDTLKNTLRAATEWMGQMVSESLGLAISERPSDAPLNLRDFEDLLRMVQGMDWAKLQELAEETRSKDVAYVALADVDGVIQLSDQLALIGEQVPAVDETEIQEERWRELTIIVSNPFPASVKQTRKHSSQRIGVLSRRTNDEPNNRT